MTRDVGLNNIGPKNEAVATKPCELCSVNTLGKYQPGPPIIDIPGFRGLE